MTAGPHSNPPSTPMNWPVAERAAGLAAGRAAGGAFGHWAISAGRKVITPGSRIIRLIRAMSSTMNGTMPR